MTFTSFQKYSEALRPTLGKAFRDQLLSILNDISLEDSSRFIGILDTGKRIRGCLSCMIGAASGGTLEAALPRATAVELIHAATLIHDDYVDQDIVRRMKPAAWSLEGARRAVLIGDVIFASAIRSMTDLGLQDGAAISHAIAETSRGALQEPLTLLALARDIASGKYDAKSYDKIIRLKTAILFGTACLLGAVSAGADDVIRNASCEYGLRIGEAYQIADDVKEMKQILSARCMRPEQLASLVPALLRFTEEGAFDLLRLLKINHWDDKDFPLELLDSAAERMENEVERRLDSAESNIAGKFADNGYDDLVRRAPRDIIGIFNES